MSYYEGSKFSSVILPMEENGNMRIILPNEGTTPEQLLSDDEALSCMLMNPEGSSYKSKLINLSIPRFDVSSGINLIDGMKSLGITDVFDYTVSDFTPLMDTSAERDYDGEPSFIYISKAEQDNRVMIDEEGCKAVSLTIIAACDGAMEITDKPIDLCIDRPFIFEILGESGLPMFVGIVNMPVE